MMISFNQLSRDKTIYCDRQRYYLNLDWEHCDYFLLKTAVFILGQIIGDIHITFEQEDLYQRYSFYPKSKVLFRLEYHGVDDIMELKWFLSAVELKQRLYYMELARRETEKETETQLGM